MYITISTDDKNGKELVIYEANFYGDCKTYSMIHNHEDLNFIKNMYESTIDEINTFIHRNNGDVDDNRN